MSQTYNKMPHLEKLMEIGDADPRSHLLAATLPNAIAAMIRAWRSPFNCHSLEEKVAGVIDAGAKELGAAAGIDFDSNQQS